MHITEEGVDVMKRGEYSALATCIYFILSGVDPFDGVKSMKELRKLQTDLAEGRGQVHPDAAILEEVIQACWTGRHSATTFAAFFLKIRAVLDPDGLGWTSDTAGQRDWETERFCRDWLRTARVDPQWKSMAEYCSEWRQVGVDGLLPEEEGACVFMRYAFREMQKRKEKKYSGLALRVQDVLMLSLFSSLSPGEVPAQFAHLEHQATEPTPCGSTTLTGDTEMSTMGRYGHPSITLLAHRDCSAMLLLASESPITRIIKIVVSKSTFPSK